MDDQAHNELQRELLTEQALMLQKPELIPAYVARYERPISPVEGAINRAILAHAIGVADDYRPGQV